MSDQQQISLLKELIAANNNALPLNDFMQFALYDLQYGYYINCNPINTDFITAPEISQLFGEIIGIWVVLQWEQLGKPTQFNLVELGPGQGTLMLDIMRVAHKYISNYVSICLVEVSPILKEVQRKTLSAYSENTTWCNNIKDLLPAPTILIANEFFDALPIRQFTYRNNKWYEKCVAINHDKLALVDRETNNNFGEQDDGCVIEVNELAHKIFSNIKSFISSTSGAALMIDYGYTKSSGESTLQAVKEHKYHDILDNLGKVDITAHVDFSLFTDCKIISQRDFLYRYGIKERAAILLKKANAKEAKHVMQSLHRLTHPELMGELFKCAVYQHFSNIKWYNCDYEDY